MKLEHYISNTIKQWPDLFARSSYEESRLPVLNHIFFSYGTGLEWCNRGFLAEHIRGRKADKRNFRIFNEMATFDDGFFQKWNDKHLSYLKLLTYLGKDVCDQVNPTGLCEYSPVVEMINGKTNSPHIENFPLNNIKEDWIEGAKEIVEYARAYYKDYNLYKYHVNYQYSEWWDNYVKEQNEYLDRFSEKFPKTV